jgi:hypothetical protein
VPSERLECPRCGGSGNLTQVEPDRYYCPHCRDLVQITSQGEASVLVTGFFCQCGAKVESQCRMCQKGLCRECDVIDWLNEHAKNKMKMSPLDPVTAENHLIIPVQGGGYLESVSRKTEVWSIEHGRIGPAKKTKSPLGPMLHPRDIFPQLPGWPHDLRHLCADCLMTGVPAAIEAIATGQVCEYPGCADTPKTNCRCCGAAFCAIHVLQTIEDTDVRYIVTRIKRGDDNWPFAGPDLVGACGICAEERMEEARELVRGLAEQTWRVKPWARGCYEDKAPLGLFGRKIDKAMMEMDISPQTCTREQWFAHADNKHRDAHLLDEFKRWGYSSPTIYKVMA